MRTPQRRPVRLFSLLAAVVAAALVIVGLQSLPGSATAAPGSFAAAKMGKRVATDFALSTSGYGTRIVGGTVPTQSDSTAYEVIGCTNYANNVRTNNVTKVTIPGLGVIDGVETKVWTEKKGANVGSWSTHEIAKVTIAETPLGSLYIRGLESMSHAWNDNGKFKAATKTNIATIVLDPAAGPSVKIPIPSPGNTVTVPGIAKLSIGGSSKKVTGDSAAASAAVLKVQVIPTKTRVILGQTRANIFGGIKSGVFKGYGAGLEGSALQDVAKLGRTPYQPMPCQGTKGQDVVKKLVGLDLDPLGTVGAVAAGVNGRNGATKAVGKAAASVADISLFDDVLQIKAVTGVASVTRLKGGKLSRSSKGSQVVEIIANGESYTLPALGALEIPGLAKLQGGVEKKLRNGLKVIGLRITLLDGSLATIDLGVAQVTIRPKG